jgi:hypothetical protein
MDFVGVYTTFTDENGQLATYCELPPVPVLTDDFFLAVEGMVHTI